MTIIRRPIAELGPVPRERDSRDAAEMVFGTIRVSEFLPPGVAVIVYDDGRMERIRLAAGDVVGVEASAARVAEFIEEDIKRALFGEPTVRNARKEEARRRLEVMYREQRQTRGDFIGNRLNGFRQIHATGMPGAIPEPFGDKCEKCSTTTIIYDLELVPCWSIAGAWRFVCRGCAYSMGHGALFQI